MKSRGYDPIREWNQMIEDFDYQEQQMIINVHMSLDELENTDYFRLIEVMSARSREDRPKTLWDLADMVDGVGRR
ncbi:hypothetical protein [Lactobacillus sp. LL6]|uniref:hypothetical protein n=1 Tax=Lactobacillus sp. LL6 TaxID=2596827 RepID=UPI001F5B9519|nr:hypothetical protein [Lactobacillus sp. LL6]